MAQYRRTTNSLGGATRIADPGADELARMLALRLQQEQQAQQGAQAQARMSLEERLAGEQMRREDQRIELARTAAQQQAALADKSFGLDERRFGEQVRQAGVGERMGEREFSLKDELGRAGLGLQREEVDLRRTGQTNEAADRKAQREQQATLARDQRNLDEKLARLAADRAQGEGKRASSERALDRQADMGRFVMGEANQDRREATRYSRESRSLEQALGERANEKDEAAQRAAIEPTALALQNFNLGPIPDDPRTESDMRMDKRIAGNYLAAPVLGPLGLLGAIISEAVSGNQDPTQELKPIVDAIDTSFAASGASTERAVYKVGEAIRNQMNLDFQRAFDQQRRDPYGIDNSQEQARLYLLALDELARVEAAHVARVGGAPGPAAPRRNVYVRPAK